MPVIRYPEMTKNTSTPTKPPASPGTPAWASTTRPMASARSPSMSSRRAAGSAGLAPCTVAGRFVVGAPAAPGGDVVAAPAHHVFAHLAQVVHLETEVGVDQ